MRARVPVSGLLSALGVVGVIAPPLHLVSSQGLAGAPSALVALGTRLVVETRAPHALTLYSATDPRRPVSSLSLSGAADTLAVTGSTLWTASPHSTSLTAVPWSARGFGSPRSFDLSSPVSALVGVSPDTLLVSEADHRVHEFTAGPNLQPLSTSTFLPAVPSRAERGATGTAWFSYPHSSLLTYVTTSPAESAVTLHAAGTVGAITATSSGTLVVGLANSPTLQITSSGTRLGPRLNLPIPGARGVLGLATSGSALFVLLSSASGDQVFRTTLSKGGLGGAGYVPAPLSAVLDGSLVTPQPVAIAATGPSDLWLLDSSSKGLQHYVSRSSRAPVLFQSPRVLDATHHVPSVGDTLRVSTGRWFGAVRLTDAWYRCAASVSLPDPTRLLDPRHTPGCRAIPRATSSSYLATSADAATHLLAVVTAVSASGAVSSSPSTWTPLLTSPPIENLALPSLSDVSSLNYRTGDVVHLAPGTWLNATSFAYQWFQCTNGVCSTPIPGATSQTYVLQPGDAGHQIAAQVTASSPVTKSVTLSTALSPPIV